ncbi:MAG: lactate racemase domain-containing protein, partial [Candidatus Hodarchaeota archaeon]
PVYEADKVIGIGTVKPHQIAGWSGGAKCIQPGVCGKETTEKTHWVFANIPKSLIIGNVDAQPRKEMERVAQQVGLDFVINVVLDRNKELSYICSGDFIEAHRNCVHFASPFFTMGFSQQADIVICGSGTWASNLWLAGGTASYADLFMKNGGTLIILASCPEGLDPEHPVIGEYGFRSYEEIAELVKQGKITDLVGATQMTQLGNMMFKRDIECILVSKGISEELAAKLNLTYAKSPQDAIEIALRKHGTNGITIYAMPGRVPGGVLPKSTE